MRGKLVVFQNTSKMLIGGGVLFLLLAFLPILADYRDFFLFAGISSLLFGIISLFFHPKTVYRDVSETLKTPPIKQNSSEKNVSKVPFITKQSTATLLFLIIIGGFLINQLLFARYNAKSNINDEHGINTAKTSLSSIDQNIITELRQQGKDVPILGSTHNHADFKVFMNENALDFAKPEYFMKSSFIHVDSNQNRDDASGVLHMHAENIPLWLFFRSLGINLTKDSLTLTDGQILKNENGKTLKFYLNGKKVDELGDYSFQPLDKLLISYGPENDPDLQKQINSVTNFAKDHQK